MIDAIDAIDAIPPGIPPELWEGQYVDRYVETGAPYPGTSAIHLDLPRRYARDWRLTCSAVVNSSANGGTDPLLQFVGGVGGGVFPLVNGPVVYPTATPPALPSPAIDWIPAVMIVHLGADRVYVDYPGRGACYQLSAHKVDVMLYFRSTIGPAGHELGRYHLTLAPTVLPTAWNTPTYTTVYASVTSAAGDYLCGAVPPRAVSCRLAPNNDTIDYSNVEVRWYSTNGTRLESWVVPANALGQPQPWAVPTRAAIVQVVRPYGGGTWITPSIVWQLSL